MIITYFNEHYLKFQVGDLVIAVNPPSSKLVNKPAKFGASLALVSINDSDFTSFDLNSNNSNNQTFLVKGPGEYEVDGFVVKGFGYNYNCNNKNYVASVYFFELDEIKVAIIAYLDSNSELTEEIKEILNEANIITAPLGTGMSPASVYQLIKSFSPNVIIPTGAINDKIVSKVFADEAGQAVDFTDKLTIKIKDIQNKDAEIIFLNKD